MKVVVFGVWFPGLPTSVTSWFLAGHQVVIFDRVASPWRQADQQMVVGDLLDADAVTNVMDKAEVVYNFAGIADMDEAMTKPVETLLANVLGNAHVLEACRKQNVQRYIYASSAYVFSRQGWILSMQQAGCRELYRGIPACLWSGFHHSPLWLTLRAAPDARNGLYRIVRAALEQGGDPLRRQP